LAFAPHGVQVAALPALPAILLPAMPALAPPFAKLPAAPPLGFAPALPLPALAPALPAAFELPVAPLPLLVPPVLLPLLPLLPLLVPAVLCPPAPAPFTLVPPATAPGDPAMFAAPPSLLALQPSTAPHDTAKIELALLGQRGNRYCMLPSIEPSPQTARLFVQRWDVTRRLSRSLAPTIQPPAKTFTVRVRGRVFQACL